MVAARKTAMPAVELPSQNKPIIASTEQQNKSPRGEILCTIGPAKNRSANMMLDVYTKSKMPFIPAMFVIRLAIQLSVPNST